MGAGCIVHCNKVSKPVKGKYLLLRMNSIMYFLLTSSYTLIMFLKILSHFIMKNKNFLKYFKEGVLKYFKISMKFLNISKWTISSCIRTCCTRQYPEARFAGTAFALCRGYCSLSGPTSAAHQSTPNRTQRLKLEDWHSEECKLTPTLTLDLLTSNKMDDQEFHVLSTCQVWWWYVQRFLFYSADIHTYIHTHTHTYTADKRPTPATTSAWVINVRKFENYV